MFTNFDAFLNKRSRFFIAVLTIGLLLPSMSCKKVKEEVAVRLLTDIMVNGRWLVDAYTVDGIDESAGFDGYEFQFTKDNKVYAINGSAQTDGTWTASVLERTIESSFPVTTEPLIKLNEKFKVTNSTSNMVEANPVNNSKNIYLKLVKKAN